MFKANRNEFGHFHAVKFYENPESLCRIVAEFLAEGFKVQEPALIIATPKHLSGIVDGLGAQGVDVPRMQQCGDLLTLDAEKMLSTFMVDGMPDAERFFTESARAIKALVRTRTNCKVRAYGEMVDVLWKQGLHAAAIRLEMLWNRFAGTHEFALLCGYAMGNFYKDANLHAIHHQHSHIVSAQGIASAIRAKSVE
jgi:hypothetical protein